MRRVDKEAYFDVVTSDLIGPMQVQSINGMRYGITFTEMNSRYRWFYPLRQKSDALEALKLFIAEINSYGFKVKCLKSDNGGEYVNELFEKFLTDNDIVPRFTSPHTPQSNSYSERFNRVLGERTRAMLRGSYLPNMLWSEAMQATTYLYNRTIGPGDPSKTPYELLFGHKPDISHLRAYGCLAYAYNFDVNRKKLDVKAIKGALVGYDSRSASYLIYVPERRTILRSGHVRFNETALLYNSRADHADNVDDLIFEPADTFNTDQAVHNDSVVLDDAVNVLTDGNSDLSATNQNSESSQSTNTQSDRPSRKRKQVHKMDLSFLADLEQLNEPQLGDEVVNISELIIDDDIDEIMSNLNNMDDRVPSCYDEAISGEDKVKWQFSINSERKSILKHDTFEFVDASSVPSWKSLLRSRWLFKIKNDGRFKSRFVVKGYSQRKGVDYDDVYAPVVGKTSLRCLMSLAATNNWDIHQMDVKTAFLHGQLDEELYLESPEGFEVPPGKVIKLKKTLYGLKQAPRGWFKTLFSFLHDNGFESNLADPCVLKMNRGSDVIIISVYVDDLLIMGNNIDLIKEFKTKISERFEMEDLGEVDKILGIQVVRDRSNRTIKLLQPQYISTLKEKFRVSSIKKQRPIPMSKATHNEIFADTSEKDGAKLDDRFPYRQAIGSILYLSICTRPDIAFATSTLAGFCSNPKYSHWRAVRELMEYIVLTDETCLTYGGNIPLNYTPNTLSIYADADFANPKNDRKSRGGYLIYLNGGPVEWHSSLQPHVSLCTSEAELYALVDACKSGIHIINFLTDLGYPQERVVCHEDNKGAKDWLNSYHGASARMKQLETKALWLKGVIQRGRYYKVQHIATLLQRADYLTKVMDPGPFYHQKEMSLLPSILQSDSGP